MVDSLLSGWTEYAVVDDKFCDTVPDTGEGKRRSAIDALSVMGLTGLTAYFGILRIGEVKKGDFVVVSGDSECGGPAGVSWLPSTSEASSCPVLQISNIFTAVKMARETE